MANLKWAEAKGISIRIVTKPGEVEDSFGNINDGPAIVLEGVVIEGTKEQLADFAIRLRLLLIAQGVEF